MALFSLAATVTLVVLVCAEAGWRGRRDFARLQAELQARGEPTELSQLEPKRLPDSENFAMLPWLQDLALKDEAQLAPVSASALRGQLDEFVRAFARLGPPVTDLDPLRRGLAPLEARLAELRTAARSLPGAQFRGTWDHRGRRPDGNAAFNYGQLFDLTVLVQLHAYAAIDARDRVTALDDLRVVQRLGESFVHGGSLLSVMISRATSELLPEPISAGRQAGLWTAEDYALFQAWLNRDDLPAALNRAMRAENIAVNNLLTNDPGRFFTEFLGKKPGSISARVLAVFGSGWLYQAAVKKDEFTRVNLAAGFDRQPPRFSITGLEQYRQAHTADRTSWNPATRIAANVVSNLGLILRESAADCAQLLAASIACALERHRLEAGRYPATLAELTPRFFPALPIDLYSGKPYVYRPTGPDTYLLYSVGENETDDGGDPAKDLVWPVQ